MGGARRHRLLRLVQVALVCLGLVAMHQMGGGDHRMPQPVAGHGLGVGAAHAMAVDSTQPPALAGAVIVAGELMIPASAGRSIGAGSVCLAVLLGLLLLAARRLTVAAREVPGTAVPGISHCSVPLGRGPPRLLLAKLCILRT